MSWIQITFEGSAESATLLSDTLSELGAASVTLQDSGDQPIFEPAPGTAPVWGATQVTALFPEGSSAKTIAADVAQRIAPEPLPAWRSEPLEERDWSRVWMNDFHPMQFGRNIWIVPSWLEPPEPDATNIMLDPGLAFGSGTHPTTGLCLDWLDGLELEGRQVIDYGCGSGILAIAGAKLGAASVLAIDIDPQALTATESNAEQNGVAAEIITALPETAPIFSADVVVANILAGPLVELAPKLAGLLNPGGKIGLSGILEQQAQMVIDAYSPYFELAPVAQREEWIRISGSRLNR